MPKIRYIGECEMRCKYGKLVKGGIIEVNTDDYQHFLTLPLFEKIVEPDEVVEAKTKKNKKVDRYKAYRMVEQVKDLTAMVVDPDFTEEKE